MKIIYRISDTGYPKTKPHYIDNEGCFRNAYGVFRQGIAEWIIIADNVSEETIEMMEVYTDKVVTPKRVSVGHGAGTFNIALDEALKFDDNEIVYFLENDYVHTYKARFLIKEAFTDLNPDYISLYDHPDKYIPAIKGGNPFIDIDGGEVTKVFASTSIHWKLTNSTTMTFAAKVKTLREDEEILRKHTSGTHPNDFQMFLELREKGRSLITPLPGQSTHGETAWLSPFTHWGELVD